MSNRHILSCAASAIPAFHAPFVTSRASDCVTESQNLTYCRFCNSPLQQMLWPGRSADEQIAPFLFKFVAGVVLFFDVLIWVVVLAVRR
jgi:hypothetical protein